MLRINAMEAEIAVPEADASDRRWEQAEWVWRALQEPGASTRRLAANWYRPNGEAYSHQHVFFTARTWEARVNLGLQGLWNDVFHSDEVRKARNNGAEQGPPPPLPEGTYDVILADPPWEYDNTGVHGAASHHYDTLPLEDICALAPLPVADNAALFLWVTNPFVRDAFEVIDAWGFTYKTNIAWVKRNLVRPGSGFYVRGRHELLFICTRGAMVPDQTGRAPIGSVLEADVQEHSRKPDEAYELIEAIYPEGQYLELFARNHRSGWTPWGNDSSLVLAGASNGS